ncbi:MAG: hypothetical protein JWN95_2592 [Frankiales bacterium]|nr:hypothetical protein [Frankiales bacterium]
MPRTLWVNAIGGSPVTPRLLRNLIYRSAALDIRTHNVSERCRFTGNGGIRVGRGTFVNVDCTFDAFGPIHVGEDCAIAMHVTITTSTHELGADGLMDPNPVGRGVHIGNRCWIGAGALILPGVTIGDGAIVAAGAVVAKNCEPRTLYAGVPAKKVRELGPDRLGA